MSSGQRGRGGGDGRGGYRGGSRGGDRGGRGDSTARGDYHGGGGRGRGRGSGGPPLRGQSQQMAYRPVGGQQGPQDPGPGIFLEGQQAPQPKAVVNNAENAMIPNIKGKVIDGFPTRPGYGTQGEHIILRVNCFELIANKDLNKADVPLYHYTISTTQQLSASQKSLLVRAIVSNAPFTESGMPWATDYANIIVTTKELPKDLVGQEQTVEVRNVAESYAADGGSDAAKKRREKKYKLVHNATLNLHHLIAYLRNPSAGAHYGGRTDLIQTLNIILNKYAADEAHIVRVGQNHFYPVPGHPGVVSRDLGEGLTALRGYYSSVRTSVGRIMINVNVAHAAFYTHGALRDLVRGFLGFNPTADDTDSLVMLEPFLNLLKVSTKYIRPRDAEQKLVPGGQPLRKIKTIMGLSRNDKDKKETVLNGPRYWDANQTTFENKDASGVTKRTSVFDYFRNHHGITLKYPKEPVLNVGRKDDAQYLPMELCEVLPGQSVRRFLRGNQTSTMIRFAARPPNANALSIQGSNQDGPGMRIFRMREEDKAQWQKPFGFEISPDMITVPARILPSPKLSYQRQDANPRFGTWNLVDKDGKHFMFYKPGKFRKWSAIGINAHVPEDLFKSFDAELRSYGIDMGERSPSTRIDIDNWHHPANRGKINDKLAQTFREQKQNGINILLVMIKDKDQWLYSRIKYYGDCKYGVHTVNVVGDNMFKQKNQGMLFGNLALKFNIKGGGTNHRIDPRQLNPVKPFDERTILFGIDVTHPSPSSAENAPSIAAVVASRDQDLCQWPGSVRAQKRRMEIVEALAEMVKERFLTWDKYNKQRPNKVIVYRDGVADGQYEQVLGREEKAFEEAFQELYGEQKNWPKLDFIIVGKRHHIRAYPTQQKDADRTFNCKAGTIIDRGITHPTRHDFYLQSHAVLQGTGRAAHYDVIKDDIGFSADELQGFTHRLCHLFNRATKAVSVCPPAYYADLLCERGRNYLYSTLAENRTATSRAYDPDEWNSGVHRDLKDSTFYI